MPARTPSANPRRHAKARENGSNLRASSRTFADQERQPQGPRRILYVQNAADLYGASRALLHLLAALDRQRFDPLVMLPADGPLAGHLRALGVEPIVAPHLRVLWGSVVRSWRAVPFGLGLLPSAIATARLIRRREVDLVHSNAWTVLSGALGARRTGCPHVWHIREILRDTGGLKPALVAYTIRRAQRLLCISEAVAAQFAGRARPGTLRVIYDGLPLTAGAADPAQASALRARCGIGPDELLIGLVGRLHPQKGQDDLLRACALLEPGLRARSRFLIVGDTLPGHERLRDQLVALARDLGVAERVCFLGFVEDIRPLIVALDVLVLPATRPEGLGGVLLEAMAAGVPVVATRAGGPAEVIDDGVSGLLVPPRRPDELARALARLLTDPQLRRDIGAAGAQAVARRFDIAATAAQVMQVYEELLG